MRVYQIQEQYSRWGENAVDDTTILKGVYLSKEIAEKHRPKDIFNDWDRYDYNIIETEIIEQ